MRAREFKIIENEVVQNSAPLKSVSTDDISADLEDLATAATQNSAVEKTVTAGLQSLLKYAKSAVSKLTGKSPSVTEDAVVYSLIDSLNDQLEHLIPLGADAVPIIETIRKRIAELTSAVSTSLQAAKTAGREEVKQSIAEIENKKQKYAQKITARLGKSSTWQKGLVSALSHFDNQLSLDFLEACVDGTGLTINLTKIPPISRYRMSEILNPKLLPMISAENKANFQFIKALPFTEGSGRGAGVGPGESFLACLIPGATGVAKGDISVAGETWEMKASSYGYNPEKGTGVQRSNAWLDCSENADKAPVLRKAFDEVIIPILKQKNRKGIRIGTNTLSLGQVIKLADFRPTALPYLQAVLQLLTSSEQYKAISAVYAAIVPTVKKKRPKLFDNSVKLSIQSILNLNGNTKKEIAELHAKLSMMEYSVGHYNSPNFIFYNSTTQEIAFTQGTKSINNAISADTGISATHAFTMQGGGKGSAGIMLTASNMDEVESSLGFQRKRAKTVR